MNVLYPILSVVIVSLVSIIFALPFFFKKKVSNKLLVFLLSVSVGVLLTTVFTDFLPESFENGGVIEVALIVLLGFLVMFILEKFVHSHHNKKCEHDGVGHSHAYHLAPVNLVGDAIHNFLDGLVIAGAYAVNVAVGIASTISIIFHEIPQEIADFGVLLYSGMSKKKALFYNFLSASTAIFGTVVGIILVGKVHQFSEFILPFAAGNFIYIAASNLVPQLHRECGVKDTFVHIFAIILGVAIIIVVTLLLPGHVHG